MTDFVVVYITVASGDEGDRMARALVEEKLAACVNRINGVRSTYTWRGKIETSQEELLLVKTSVGLFDKLAERVRELHSYDVPEIIAVPILRGDEDYLNWMAGVL